MRQVISVVIPVKNRPIEIRRAVNSIMRQSFLPNEIVIVDDGSTDDTSNVINSMSNENSLIKFIRLDTSRGASGARNIGCYESKGDLVAFLDSDDEWLPEKLETQMVLFDAHPSTPAVGCGMIYDYNNRPPLTKIPPFLLNSDNLSEGNKFGSASVAVVKKEFFQKIGGFDESLPNCEDWDLWFRLSEFGDLISADSALVRYTYDGNNKLSRQNQKLIDGHNIIRKKILRNITDKRRIAAINSAHEMKLAEIGIKTIGSITMGLNHSFRSIFTNPSLENINRAFRLFGYTIFNINKMNKM